MKTFILFTLAVIGCSAFGQSTTGKYLADGHQLDADNTDVEEPDIYWRTWTGKIPKDAIIGGYTENDCGADDPTYIGQVLHPTSEGEIVPVQIFRRHKSIKLPVSGRVNFIKKGIQIMCAPDPSIVTWLSREDMRKYSVTPRKHCITVGDQQSISTFFTRTKHNGNTVIGKVDDITNVMHFANDDGEVLTRYYEELLCYTKAVENRKLEMQEAYHGQDSTPSTPAEVITKKAPEPVVAGTTTHMPFIVRFG